MQDMEAEFRLLFEEGNRDVFLMGITFAKRGGNITDRHITPYTRVMNEMVQAGVFVEGITMTERGGLLTRCSWCF